MSESKHPILFTEAEQLNLQELQTQVEGFNSFANVVKAGSYPGTYSTTVASLLQFLQNMVAQSSQQIEQVKVEAQTRANTPKEESVKEPQLLTSKKAS